MDTKGDNSVIENLCRSTDNRQMLDHSISSEVMNNLSGNIIRQANDVASVTTLNLSPEDENVIQETSDVTTVTTVTLSPDDENLMYVVQQTNSDTITPEIQNSKDKQIVHQLYPDNVTTGYVQDKVMGPANINQHVYKVSLLPNNFGIQRSGTNQIVKDDRQDDQFQEEPQQTVVMVTENMQYDIGMTQSIEEQAMQPPVSVATDGQQDQMTHIITPEAVVMECGNGNLDTLANTDADRQITEALEVNVENDSESSVKILKIFNPDSGEGNISGNLVLDEALLRAILLATSSGGNSVETVSDDINATEVISCDQDGQTFITIVQEGDQVNIDSGDSNHGNQLVLQDNTEYVLSQSTTGAQQIIMPVIASNTGSIEAGINMGSTVNSGTNTDCVTMLASELQNRIENVMVGTRNIPQLKITSNLCKSSAGKMRISPLKKPISKGKIVSVNSVGTQVNERGSAPNVGSAAKITVHCDICDKDIRKCYFKSHYAFHTGVKKFTCEICEKSFGTSQHLRRHQVVHSKEKPYKCDVCGNCYTQSTHLKIHQRCHRDERNYHCTVCKKSFYQPQNLKRHMISHTSDRPHKCSKCHKTFKFKDHLLDHERVHLDEPLYQCEVCDLSFKMRSTYHAHKVNHSPEKMARYKRFQGERKRFNCKKCKKYFKIESKLDQHKCGEEKKLDFMCDICTRRFATRGTLIRHRCPKAVVDNLERSHSCMTCGQRHFSEHLLREHQLHAHIKNTTFCCEICGYKILEDEIKSHLDLHVGKTDTYKCHLCDEEYNDSDKLKKHLTTTHPQKLDPSPKKSSTFCKICEKNFKTGRQLVSHLHKHHGKEEKYGCHICKTEFESDLDLIDHLKIHGKDVKEKKQSLDCEICGKTFVNNMSFKKHLVQHKGDHKPHKCLICSEEFDVLEVCRKHVQEDHTARPKQIQIFICKYCKKSFIKEAYLNEHMKSHLGANNKFQCVECSEEFEHLGELKDHCILHKATDKSYECTFCLETFSGYSALLNHVEKHKGVKKSYKCLSCREEFNESHQLFRHIKTSHQTGDKVNAKSDYISGKVFCDICGKGFSNQRHLKHHFESIVGKTQQFHCPKYKKEFQDVSDLKLHVEESHYRAATSGFPKQCDICLKVFKNKSSYNLHHKSHQGKAKKYKCPCGEEFKDLEEIVSHVKSNLVIVTPTGTKEEGKDGGNKYCYLTCKGDRDSQLLTTFCTAESFDYEGYIRNFGTALDEEHVDIGKMGKTIDENLEDEYHSSDEVERLVNGENGDIRDDGEISDDSVVSMKTKASGENADQNQASSSKSDKILIREKINNIPKSDKENLVNLDQSWAKIDVNISGGNKTAADEKKSEDMQAKTVSVRTRNNAKKSVQGENKLPSCKVLRQTRKSFLEKKPELSKTKSKVIETRLSHKSSSSLKAKQQSLMENLSDVSVNKRKRRENVNDHLKQEGNRQNIKKQKLEEQGELRRSSRTPKKNKKYLQETEGETIKDNLKTGVVRGKTLNVTDSKKIVGLKQRRGKMKNGKSAVCKVFICYLCEDEFDDRDELKKHLRHHRKNMNGDDRMCH